MQHDMRQKLEGLDGFDLNDILSRLNNLENEMGNKVDKKDFSNEIAALR